VSAAEKEKRLLIELASDSRAPVELPRAGVLSIGSDRARVDLWIEGQGVSPVHCAIGRVKGGGWALKDLGSEYGVMVNGARVATHKLEAGDQILVGSRRLRVVDADAPAPAAAKPAAAQAKPAAATAKPAAAPATEVPSSAATGRARDGADAGLPQVKGYRVERLLGRGGMGEVYLAVQESLGRPVALKVLASKLAADSDFVRRFQAEARAAAALNHPNVVTVHDVWEESGRHFLAMEYMDRGNLEMRLAREGKLGVKEALDVMTDAAKALVYAELRGIVHRDIKPANLMQNSAGTTKLADLGLAMHLEAEATESDNKKIFGTPHFISPEQARGEKTDVRSDMYSLGATAYRLLSGRTPFEGATTRDILRGHFLDQPKPLGELVEGLRPELVAIVDRLLRKKPDERYPSANVLLQEIERVKGLALQGAPAAAPSSSRSGLWVGVGLAVAAAVGVAWWMNRESAPQERNRDVVDDNPSRANGAGASSDEPSTDPSANESTGASTTPSGTAPVRPSDDDTALKLRETEAENAYLKLPRDLTSTERRDALRELAERFAGTTAGGRYSLEADELARAIDQQTAAASAASAASNSWIERARLAIGVGEQRKPLADALRAFLALETTPELNLDSAFAVRRRALVSETVVGALAECRAALSRADELERKGDFEGLGTLLRPWLVALDLPPLPPDLGFDAVPELAEVNALRGLVQKRVDSLETARERFVARVSEGDSKSISSALRGEQGIEGALLNFDLAGLEARLTALQGALASEPAKAWVSGLRQGLSDGRAALAALGAELEAGNWRRKSVPDPRARGRANRDAVSLSAEGLLLKGDAGGELAPWSAFGARPSDLHQLFFQRLGREYTPQEQRGIEALVRTAAVVFTLREVEDLFHPTTPGVLSEEEAAAIAEAFEVARHWSAGGADSGAVEREARAAAVLVDAIRCSAHGSWSLATVRYEELFAEYGDTLLVRLLSDGRGAANLAPTGR
jgi:serine/threonine protein kinase